MGQGSKYQEIRKNCVENFGRAAVFKLSVNCFFLELFRIIQITNNSARILFREVNKSVG